MKNSIRGNWGRLSVVVNSRQVMDYEGNVLLEIKGNHLRFQPVGLRFFIESTNGDHVVLSTGGRRYRGDIELTDEGIRFRLRGIETPEEMVVSAVFDEHETNCLTDELIPSSR